MEKSFVEGGVNKYMLRKKEDDKFERFFDLVKNKAAERDCVFFLDCGQGREFENDFFICEDLCGWLLPRDMANNFVPLFMENSETQHEYDEFYVYVTYEVNGDNIKIVFDDELDDFVI